MDGRVHSGPDLVIRRSWGVEHCRVRMAELGVDAAGVAGLLFAAATADYGAERASALVRELSHQDYQLPAEVRAQLLWQVGRRDLLGHADDKSRSRT